MHRPTSTRGTKHKSGKGYNMFHAQNRKAKAKRMAMEKDNLPKQKRNKISDQVREQLAKFRRWYQLHKHLKGKYTPHQGPQERNRRVRQMREHKCINPEVWGTDQ